MMSETAWEKCTDSANASQTQLWQSRKDPGWNQTPPSRGFSTDGLETLIKSLNVGQTKFFTL